MPRDLVAEGFLTDHQNQVVTGSGNLFVNACPGSGKTRAAAARVAKLMADGKRVAVFSYTNVGVAQISAVIRDDLGGSFASDCFIGTLHGFLLRYVVYPFGHLVTGSSNAPTLIRKWRSVQVGPTAATRLDVDKFVYQPDDTLVARSGPQNSPITADQATTAGRSQAKTMKDNYARAGFVSTDDAMYYALQVLKKYPKIAANVAARFDELVVDEAQDTSLLQLECLRVLVETGCLASLVLIGDKEQSIYSFNGARPDACTALATRLGLSPITLHENHRSSQLICDITTLYSGHVPAYRAVGATADCPWKPRLLRYRGGDLASLTTAFEQLLQECGIDSADATILTRANELADRINGSVSPSGVSKLVIDLGKGLVGYSMTRTITTRVVDRLDEHLARCAFDQEPQELSKEDRWVVRKATMLILAALPSPELPVKEWLAGARGAVTAALATVTASPKHTSGVFLKSTGLPDAVSAKDCFTSARPTDGLRARTIHDVKGESCDAVLVVADHAAGNRRRPSQSELWSLRLSGGDPTVDPEEHRVIFVALSRARRLCVLAVPDTVPMEICTIYENAGFQLL